MDQQQDLLSPSSSSTPVLPSYPLLDTFSCLSILMILPHWLSTFCLLLYVLLGNPRFLDSLLSLVLKHKLNGLHSQDHNQTSIVRRLSIVSFITFLSLDAILIAFTIYFCPSLVPYITLLSKAFVASNMTSSRNRFILDAILASVLLLCVESTLQYLIRRFEILRGDSILALTSSYSSVDFQYPFYFKSPVNVARTLIYHISFHRIRGDSKLVFGVELCVQFLHSTLSLYTIMHNINPILRKLAFVNNFFKFFESLIIPLSFFSSDSTNNTDNNDNESKFNDSSFIHNEHKTNLPSLQYSSSINIQQPIYISKEISRSELPNISNKNQIHEDFDVCENSDNDLEQPSSPMWFPLDHQIVNMSDISSPTLVVAQNFENYCKLVWFPSISQDPYSNSLNTTTNPVSTSSRSKFNNSSSSVYLSTGSPKRTTPPVKWKNPYIEKKIRYMGLKNQQPLWTFLNAARAMFSKQDLYSGDYYQHNAIATTGNGVDDYAKNFSASPQCFIWFTGETTVAFELHNISLEQLLIKVNGIIWAHVSSCGLFGREMIIVNGLSPLSQYDVDFVKITLNGDLVHLASTTVSTVHQNKTVTETKPSSPLTTLQRSVVTTQDAIEREKARLKKLKADWRKRSSALKTEIDNLNNRANMSDETRNYKKLDSLRQAVAKSDVELSNMSKKSEELHIKQTEVEERYLDEKRIFETESRHMKKTESDYKLKLENEEEKRRVLISEKNQLLQKKDKVNAKKQRIHRDVEVLTRELEVMKEKEIKVRRDKRKMRSDQREEKYKLLMTDIRRFEKQLKLRSLNSM